MFEPVGLKDYTSIIINHFREVNVHNLSHYLLNPRAYIPFFNKVVSRKAVSKEEEVKAVGEFKQFTTDVLKDLASKLSSIKSGLGEDPASKEWIQGLLEFYLAMEAAQ